MVIWMNILVATIERGTRRWPNLTARFAFPALRHLLEQLARAPLRAEANLAALAS
jgi:hypothetical protein